MKNVLLFLILNFSLITFAEQVQEKESLLVVLLMVKNEATVMEKTLEPFLQAGVDSYLILDTGSTDNTISVTQEVFKKYSVKHGYIVEQPFVDFATSRNYAIQQAEEKFPNAQFFLMIDAEWYMHNVQGLIEFCKSNQDNLSKAFFIKMNANKDVLRHRRLFKPHLGIYFEGVVHERLNYTPDIQDTLPNSIYFTYSPEALGQEKSKNRWLRDIDLLLKEDKKNPNNLRTLFYLGQTYQCLDDYENAIIWYKKRCELNDNYDEKYVAYYRLATIYEKMNNNDQAVFYYVKAAEFDTGRAEPLVRLALHYWNAGNYVKCFNYAYKAVQLDIPSYASFVEMELYTFVRYGILSTVSVYVGQYVVGKWATMQGLQVQPDNPALLANLKIYSSMV